MSLCDLGTEIAGRRRALKLSQAALARQAGISRATIEALENGRARELGFSKITRLLTALGLELKLQPATSRRPTFEELLEENRAGRDADD